MKKFWRIVWVFSHMNFSCKSSLIFSLVYTFALIENSDSRVVKHKFIYVKLNV